MCETSTDGHMANPWEWFVYPVRLIRENNVFICEWFSVEERFWVRSGALRPLLLSVLGPHLVQTCAGPVRASSDSVRCYTHQITLTQDGQASLISSLPSGSYTLHLLFCKVLWALREWIWWRHPFRAESFKSLPLCVMSGYGSLHPFLSAAGGSFYDDNWGRHWSMSIRLFCFFFFKICVFGARES